MKPKTGKSVRDHTVSTQNTARRESDSESERERERLWNDLIGGWGWKQNLNTRGY